MWPMSKGTTKTPAEVNWTESLTEEVSQQNHNWKGETSSVIYAQYGEREAGMGHGCTDI